MKTPKIKRFKEGNGLTWGEMSLMSGISGNHLQNIDNGKKTLTDASNRKLEAIGCFTGYETMIKDKRESEFSPRLKSSRENPLQFALSEYMRRTGSSQTDIMNKADVHTSILYNVISHGTMPSLSNFAKLCNCCEFDANEIVGQM